MPYLNVGLSLVQCDFCDEHWEIAQQADDELGAVFFLITRGWAIKKQSGKCACPECIKKPEVRAVINEGVTVLPEKLAMMMPMDVKSVFLDALKKGNWLRGPFDYVKELKEPPNVTVDGEVSP